TANPANGTAPYFYRWSNNQNTQTINNLASGSYSVTVTDNNGCSAIASTLITEGGSLQLELSVTDVTCNGLTNGEIRSSVTGGQAPFTYQWSNNSTTQNLTNLPAGVYALTITDVNGCQDIQQTRVEQPANLIATTSTIASTCNSTNGEIAVSVGGGTAPYTYRWNDANNSTSQVINNIAAGTYTVTVTDANGCTTSSVGTVTNTASPTVTISKNDALCNGNNGAASANVNSGTAPYTYRWSNNETTQTINNLSSGNYTVTVTDNNGCTATATTNIQASTSPLVSINPVNATCDSNNGSAAANVTSGAAPYTYRWSNNQTTAIINNLNDGTYTVTVTDNNGCTATATTTIQTTSNPTVIVSTTDEICGNQNGTATAEASGGTAPYTYRWTNNQTTRTATNLASGSYTVTVTDANGCTAIASTTISGSNPVVAAISPTSAAVCSGESVQLNATPDATNATYEWTATGGSFDNSTVANPIYTMMMPGTYTITVTVRRADGCSDTVTTTVTINANPVVAIQPPAPDLCGGGSIDFVADVSGGTTGLTYAWSANVGTFNDNTLAEPTYTINQVGTYEVSLTVTNSAGCTATTQSSVTVTDAPTCEAVITSDYDGLDVSTYNGSDGAATVNVAGGSGDYTYRWSNGQTTESVSNLGAGSYRVTVTDGNSCQCISSVRLRDAAKLGNFVWNDVDKDGIQDGNEPGIPNVTVTLTGTNINGGTVNRTTTTDATGMYMFDGLVPGDYKVTFTQPTGFRPTVQDQGGDDAMDSDINPNTGMTQVVTLDYGDYDETLDAGYFSSGVNIGDFVFIDSNRNGIQDNGEEGLSDVILVLVDKGPDNIYGTSDDNTIGQTMTNFFGDYLFENVPVGSYIIHIVRNSLPRNYQLTTRNAGTDDEIDSDFNTNTLVSDMFMVNETQSDDLSHDVGVFPICDNVTDAGEIAADEAVCGAGSIPSLITSVRDASGGGGELQDYLWLRSTLSVFNGIEDPNWVVIDGATEATYQPEQIYETTYYIRCARREDCPDYRETNIVQKRIVPYPTSDLESGSTSVCTNESSTYVAEIGGFGNVTYDWHFGDNAVPQTASGRAATASWTTAGTKTISLNVIQNGCASYTTYTITVVECPGLLGNFTTVEAELTTEYAVDLMWMTEGEPVNTNYVIQRANADASKFETIDLMPAKGGTTTQTYHCVDVKPNIGKNYYRVKHFDVNGRFTYSNVVEIMVQPQGTKDVIFYPNPFRDQTTLQVVGEVETDVNVQIVSAYGQVVDVQTVPLGTNFYNLDLSTYPKGVYYVYVTYNGYRKASYRLLKTDDN
ncbi:MAG: SdrD B-like domain-containing protein, partial [Saprospiraceae bacterium]